MSGANHLVKISRQMLSEVLAGTWKEDRPPQPGGEDEATLALRRLLQTQHPLIVEEVFHCLKDRQSIPSEGEDIVFLEEPESPEDIDEPVVIRPLAYLRAMLSIAWEAFRHPFSTSRIDLTTGRVVDRF